MIWGSLGTRLSGGGGARRKREPSINYASNCTRISGASFITSCLWREIQKGMRLQKVLQYKSIPC